MIDKLKEIFHNMSIRGIKFPYAYDVTTGKPSITLLFPYVTFVIAVVSVIALHFSIGLFIATSTAIGFWVIAVIFYMLRRISKAKFDLDDKSFELESGDEDESK